MKGVTGIKLRREGAKKQLEALLKHGTKLEKNNGKTTSKLIPLTDSDKCRIKRGIENLSQKKK